MMPESERYVELVPRVATAVCSPVASRDSSVPLLRVWPWSRDSALDRELIAGIESVGHDDVPSGVV